MVASRSGCDFGRGCDDGDERRLIDRVFRRRKGLPANWDLIAADQWAMWSTFSVDERIGLADIGNWLVKHKHWEAANGFALTDEIVTTIALEAALLVLELGIDYYDGVGAIIVHPTTIVSRGEWEGPAGTILAEPAELLGEAHDQRGPVMIAWDDARRAARKPGRGRNVVFHEFAHKIDMLDDTTDGTPPIESVEELASWIVVCTELYESLSDGVPRPPLDMYGGTNPAEFFAVATETFFDAPIALEQLEPQLYEVLRDFYDQDPAERARPPLA